MTLHIKTNMRTEVTEKILFKNSFVVILSFILQNLDKDNETFIHRKE